MCDQVVLDDVCTLYFDYDFDDVQKICNLLRKRGVSFKLTTRSGMAYIPKFKYWTLSFLNKPKNRSHIAKVFYQLNVPENQIRSRCESLIEMIQSEYNNNITKWFRSKLGEINLVKEIISLVGCDYWWTPTEAAFSRVSIRRLLSIISEKDYRLFGLDLVTNYLTNWSTESDFIFYSHDQRDWHFLFEKFLNEWNLNDLTTEEAEDRACTFCGLEIGEISISFANHVVPTFDVESVCLDNNGIPHTILKKQHVDIYVRKIQAKEMEFIGKSIGEEESEVVQRYKGNGWKVTNVAYNSRERKYVSMKEVEAMKLQVQSLEQKLEGMKSELDDIKIQ